MYHEQMRAVALGLFLTAHLSAGITADTARAIRENSFDRAECYRIRDLTFIQDDIRIYLTDGYVIFSKPVAGRRTAAVFSTDVDGGDGEVMLLPSDRAERRSLAVYTDSPNLDEHIKAAVLLFTGNVYENLMAQMGNNPANRKAPEMGPVLDEQWTPVLRNLGESYQSRLTLDLVGGPAWKQGLLAALMTGTRLGNFDLVYDPNANEQISIGQVAYRENRAYFDTWASFPSKSARQNPRPVAREMDLRDYRIEATVNPDLSMDLVTRVKVKAIADGIASAPFDIAGEMNVSEVKVDGVPAEVLQAESLRVNLARRGNHLFLVSPKEPLRAGREYEFEFRYSGNVIHDTGDHVFFISARANWYPAFGVRFTNYDLLFRYPREYDLVSVGDVVEDRVDGDTKISRRRTSQPIRVAAFNLGVFEHARLERGGYVVDVCANRRLERSLQPRQTVLPAAPPSLPGMRRRPDTLTTLSVQTEAVPSPTEHLTALANEVASALEFMAGKFGPPALPHLTVSPIPGTFGQGFPGLIYLSTLSYFRRLPARLANGSQSNELFFQDVLQAHETAHQWWGNRVAAATYRDNWLMEALANYSALMYVEKRRGAHALDLMLENYRDDLIQKNENGKLVDSVGPIVLGTRLESSIEPRAWRAITYGKGSWIMQMLRGRMGDERFSAMLGEITKRYDRKEISTEAFRLLAAEFLPPKADDPKLETFFGQWVYGTGIPTVKMTYSVKGVAPNVKVTGTITQSDVDEDFTALVPVEIQIARGKSVVQWVRTSDTPATFSVNLKAPPLKVLLDPHHGLLRK
jgi:hypothetical protein